MALHIRLLLALAAGMALGAVLSPLAPGTWIEWANGERELYDDNADPYQLSNLAADPALEATRMQLARLNADLKACRGPVCKAVEDRAPVQLAR